MKSQNNQVCPASKASSLDSRVRHWLQNPNKILLPYIQEGMNTLDIGCVPGFFKVEMAKLVGENGRVIAADLQNPMLEKLEIKIQNNTLKNRIKLHKCDTNKIGITDEKLDFVLLFYVVHEIPDKRKLFTEIKNSLKTNGKVLIVEPKIHTSKSSFKNSIEEAIKAGFKHKRLKKYFSAAQYYYI